MGKLLDYKNLVDEKTQALGKDQFKIRGQIGLRCGLMLSSIDAQTPDNPNDVQALKTAIKEVLGIDV